MRQRPVAVHKETVLQNVVASIDPKTGEKTINPASMPHIGRPRELSVIPAAAPAGDRLQPWTGMLFMPPTSTHHADPLDPGLYTGAAALPWPVIGAQQRRQYRRVDAIKLADALTGRSIGNARPRPAGAADRRRPGSVGDLDRNLKAPDATGRCGASAPTMR
jgi:hypothetical protein